MVQVSLHASNHWRAGGARRRGLPDPSVATARTLPVSLQPRAGRPRGNITDAMAPPERRERSTMEGGSLVRPMKLKRILKWTTATVLLALVVWVFIAYWTSTNDCDRTAAAPAVPMKSIVQCEYVSPDVLKLADVEKPVPNDNQLLVR